MLLALPAGMLADRFGRIRVFLGGHILLLAAYMALLLPSVGIVQIGTCVILFGAYYAGTDGVLLALVSTRVSRALRSTGMACVTTMTGLARFAASLGFGWLWTLVGLDRAIVITAAALLIAIAVSVVLFGRETVTIYPDEDPARS
jgi:MFS family permease